MSLGRVVAFIVLAGLLFGLFVHYGAAAPRHDDSPTGPALNNSYETHIGDHIYRWARITAVRDETIVVRSGSLTLTVLDRPPTAEEGDAVQIDGRLAQDHRVVPDRIVVSDARKLTYMYVISAIGGLWAAGFFYRQWTVDWQSYSITSREDSE